ncbi:MAG: HypC/HybG/HupF family hydrogenase formation chaperone [Candidatus Riflebacteria bacterium]|nr:HypC/HybG/HupF family hydrogenase formation chaperone [Candidatus Riflebacteria bacterium]
MCLAVPGKVLDLDGLIARVDFGGVTREVAMDLLPEVRVGDYVIVHAGYAIQMVDEAEAMETLRLFEQLAELEGQPQE